MEAANYKFLSDALIVRNIVDFLGGSIDRFALARPFQGPHGGAKRKPVLVFTLGPLGVSCEPPLNRQPASEDSCSLPGSKIGAMHICLLAMSHCSSAQMTRPGPFTTHKRAHTSLTYRRTERDLPKVCTGLPIRWRTNRNVQSTASDYICQSYKHRSIKRPRLDQSMVAHVGFPPDASRTVRVSRSIATSCERRAGAKSCPHDTGVHGAAKRGTSASALAPTEWVPIGRHPTADGIRTKWRA
jgi:hypothetical protein